MADSTRSHAYKRRNKGGQDAKLARNLAAIQALNSSSSRFTTGSNRSSKRGSSSSPPGRLKFLLSILLVTSLLLVILQTFRHLRLNSSITSSSSSSSSFESRLKRAQAILQSKKNDQGKETIGWKDRIVNAASVVMDDSSAQDPMRSAAAITSQREKKVDDSENSLDWKTYLAGMKKHFDEELNKVKKTPEELVKDAGERVESKVTADIQNKHVGGMAIGPSDNVHNHVHSVPFDQQDLPVVEGKSDQEAKSDRKVALEDIDQETLKAMFDALYGRG